MFRDYNVGDRVKFCGHPELGTVTGFRDSTNPMRPGIRFIVEWDYLTVEDLKRLPVMSYRAEQLVLVSAAPVTV